MAADDVSDGYFMRLAFEEALAGYRAGGCPIGAVLVDPSLPADPCAPEGVRGAVLGKGHNRLVQEGNPVLHGEMSAFRAAGRLASRAHCTLYTSLSPCSMCAGAILMFKVRRVVVGDVSNADGPRGDNIEHLRSKGVVVDVQESHDCVALCAGFRKERPDLWLEDWGGPGREE